MRGSKHVPVADQAAAAAKRQVIVERVAVADSGHVRELLGVGCHAPDDESRRNVALLLRQVESRPVKRQRRELRFLFAELRVLSAL